MFSGCRLDFLFDRHQVGIATQVTLSDSTKGLVSFSNIKGDTTDVVVGFTGNCGEGGNNCVSGSGLFGTTLGSYKLWITGGPPLLTPPDVFDIYGVNLDGATISFSLLLTDSSLLQGTFDLGQLSGGSTRAPEFLGNFTASYVSGDFVGSFVVGETSADDFTVFLAKGVDVDLVYQSQKKGAMVAGPISSGEIIAPVPEPGSLGLLGTGLLTAAGFLRRRVL